jgi:hypothetical protein
MAPRVVREQNMITSPAGLGTKNGGAGEEQQQFTRLSDGLVLPGISCYLK